MNSLLFTFLVAMTPVIELRGAIPLAVARGVPPLSAACAAVFGNLLPVPFILLFIRRTLDWLNARSARCRRLAAFIERHADKRAPAVQRGAFWGLALFVAVPLPGTGAWSGALIAALLDMPLRRALAAIALGVLLAGTVMALASTGVLITLTGG